MSYLVASPGIRRKRYMGAIPAPTYDHRLAFPRSGAPFIGPDPVIAPVRSGSTIVFGGRTSFPIGPATPVIVGPIESGGSSGQPTYTHRRAGNRYSGNTTGQPSTILNYDAQGNPIYSVPPAGQVITSYDASGNPIYGPATSGNQLVPGTGMTETEYQAYIAAQQAATAGSTAAAPSTSVTTSTDTYGSIVDFLNSDSLISGVANFWIFGGGAVLWLLISRKRQGR